MEKNELIAQLYGTDANRETSLFEYGLLVAPYTKDGNTDEYFCVYSIGNGQFDAGHKREKELNDLIEGREWAKERDIESFLSTLGMSKDEWLLQSFVMKLYDCLQCWGYLEIMGECYSPIDTDKARELYL